MGKNNKDGGLFERFLIMIFGLAVVLLGAYPLTREYGGIRKYLAVKGEQLAKYYDTASSDFNSAKREVRASKSSTNNPQSSRSRLGTSNFPDAKKSETIGFGLDSLFDFSIFGNSSDKEKTAAFGKQQGNYGKSGFLPPSRSDKDSRNLKSSSNESMPLDKVSVEDKKQLDDLIQNVVD